MVITRDLERIAGRQHGLLTSKQLREAAISPAAESTLLARGGLQRVRRGVVRLTGSLSTWEQSLAALCLSIGAPVAASHLSAVRLWGLRSHDTDLELTLPYTRNSRVRGATVHRSTDLVDIDIVERLGIPTTSIERTLCDVGARVSPRELQRITDHALGTNLTSPDRLARFVERVGTNGRPGVAAMRQRLTAQADSARLAESGPELALARLCTEYGLPRPVPQHAVRIRGRRYRVDLAYPDQRVFLEFDGLRWHSSPEAIARDHRRQNALTSAGWLPLRFAWLDLTDRPAAVADEIRRTLALR